MMDVGEGLAPPVLFGVVVLRFEPRLTWITKRAECRTGKGLRVGPTYFGLVIVSPLGLTSEKPLVTVRWYPAASTLRSATCVCGLSSLPRVFLVRSERLYFTEQAYISGTTEVVELYDGAFLQLIGRGEGTVNWDGREGTIEWTNFPLRRPDGVYLPDITGLIKLADSEHTIIYRMQGISLLPDEQNCRLVAGPVRWYTDDPEFSWLNDRWGFEEGELDTETSGFKTAAYALHPDRPA